MQLIENAKCIGVYRFLRALKFNRGLVTRNVIFLESSLLIQFLDFKKQRPPPKLVEDSPDKIRIILAAEFSKRMTCGYETAKP